MERDRERESYMIQVIYGKRENTCMSPPAPTSRRVSPGRNAPDEM